MEQPPTTLKQCSLRLHRMHSVAIVQGAYVSDVDRFHVVAALLERRLTKQVDESVRHAIRCGQVNCNPARIWRRFRRVASLYWVTLYSS